MKKVLSRLAKQPSNLFNVNFALDYTTFTTKYIIADPTHPLHETQKRKAKERKKEGLWWHTTTSVDTSKSSCVRAWARRRLSNAVIEELRARGYDRDGKFINAKLLHSKQSSLDGMSHADSPHLMGSLRLHVQAPLLPAKFADIKTEMGKTLDIVIEAMRIGNSRPISRLPTQTRTKTHTRAKIKG
ncbi:hypothetical protein GQ44DRAFT_624262 [Phaeosphaeriaceae sp. PMI808]|nr:hypothetical protein GQ44DRAFT_624262 [Phaeosphaeriaceae sp. PMI808]